MFNSSVSAWQAVHGEDFHGWVIKALARLICIAQGGSNHNSMLGIMTDGLKSVIIMGKVDSNMC